LGRDIAVAASTLRIRQPYLQAIEDGRFNELPGATYAVGFVRGYAEYLGLDGNEIVRRFKQENRDLARRAELVFPSTASGSGLPTGALLGIAVVGAAIAYGVWYWLQEREQSSAETVPPLPERLAALIHKPVGDGSEVVKEAPPPAASDNAATAPAVAPAPATENPSPSAAVQEPAQPAEPPAPAAVALAEPAKPAAAETEAPKAEPAKPEAPKAEAPKPNWRPSKRVLLRAEGNCWIKIRDNSGQLVLSRMLHKGDVFSPPDAPGLEMTVGNAGALTVLVDGKEIPSLGPSGQVKHVRLDPEKLDKTASPSAPVDGGKESESSSPESQKDKE
jgi:cytoskeleton protein RodZ